MDKEYQEVSPEDLGEYFTRHMAAMTIEGLYSKSDIAEQLGWRDQKIDLLKAKLARVEALADEFGLLEIRANSAADRNEYLEDHLQNVGRTQAYCECKQKLREAIGEKEAG